SESAANATVVLKHQTASPETQAAISRSEGKLMKHRIHRANLATLVLTASILAPAPLIVAQSQSTVAPTKIVFHKNKYSPEDDVKVGRQAASQAERQLPLLRDREVNDYLETLGQRLVAATPEEFQHPEF